MDQLDDSVEEFSYDWYNEIGYQDFSALKPGIHVLFEEHALIPEMDEAYYQRLRRIKIPPTLHRVSPRGFIHIDPSDDFWIDPRYRSRRIHEARIALVTPAGEVKFGSRPDGPNPVVSRRCIVDILSDAQDA